jgi:IclR family acetate operon transcriptional repressor
MSSTQPYSVVALERGLEVLQLLATEDRAYSLQELVDRAALPKTTVFRLLVTLERKGFVERTPDGRHRIGLQLGRLGKFAHATFDLRRISEAELKQLHESSSDTVNLASWRNDQIIYVEVLVSPLRTKIVELPGTVAPLHASALGKAVAAYLGDEELRRILGSAGFPRLTSRTITNLRAFNADLAKTRARGFSLDREETDLDASCIGGPIFDANGVVGAVSVSATTARMNIGRVRILAPQLLAACRSISAKLGALSPSVAVQRASARSRKTDSVQRNARAPRKAELG